MLRDDTIIRLSSLNPCENERGARVVLHHLIAYHDYLPLIERFNVLRDVGVALRNAVQQGDDLDRVLNHYLTALGVPAVDQSKETHQ
jgi:hypothetical protein